MRRWILRWVGNGLIVGGVTLLAVTGGLLVYSQFEEFQATQEVQAMGPPPTFAPAATPAPTFPATATAEPLATFVGAGNGEGIARVAPTATAIPTDVPPTPTPIPILPAERIIAPTIGLDTKVVESGIVNGEWTVPKFVAGHLQGTSLPLAGGNVVLSGHVQSISSGNVFAKIGNLHPGDTIRLYTKATVVTYTVSRLEVVANTDVEVIQPTSKEQLTLITCTGKWLPLKRDYDSRMVVVADRQP